MPSCGAPAAPLGVTGSSFGGDRSTDPDALPSPASGEPLSSLQPSHASGPDCAPCWRCSREDLQPSASDGLLDLKGIGVGNAVACLGSSCWVNSPPPATGPVCIIGRLRLFSGCSSAFNTDEQQAAPDAGPEAIRDGLPLAGWSQDETPIENRSRRRVQRWPIPCPGLAGPRGGPGSAAGNGIEECRGPRPAGAGGGGG